MNESKEEIKPMKPSQYIKILSVIIIVGICIYAIHSYRIKNNFSVVQFIIEDDFDGPVVIEIDSESPTDWDVLEPPKKLFVADGKYRLVIPKSGRTSVTTSDPFGKYKLIGMNPDGKIFSPHSRSEIKDSKRLLISLGSKYHNEKKEKHFYVGSPEEANKYFWH